MYKLKTIACLRIFVVVVYCHLAEEGSGFDTTVSHFQIFRKNPNLKKCAFNILQENQYLGVRISEKTGKCDQYAYISIWRAMQPGYAYAKQTFGEETFQPPVDLISSWKIPGVFDSGARLDMSIQIKKPEDLRLLISLNGVVMRISFEFSRGQFSCYDELKNKLVYEKESYTAVPVAFTSEGVVKVSLLAQSDSVTMSVENEEFVTVPVDKVRSLFRLTVRPSYGITEGIGIHRVEFTGK